MASLFAGAGTADGEAPTAEQFNLGFQKMAGLLMEENIWKTAQTKRYFFS